MTILPNETPDQRTVRLIALLITEGNAALERTVILEAPAHRRRAMLTHRVYHSFLLDTFPEGLPEWWLKDALDADWATWYREGRRGR